MANYCRNCGERIPEKRNGAPRLWCDECRKEVDRELDEGNVWEVGMNTLGNILKGEPELRKEVDRLTEKNRKLEAQVNALLFTVKMQEGLIRELREKKCN